MKRRRVATTLGVALSVVGACALHEPYRVAVPLGLDLFIPIPAENPLSLECVALGRRLFFDQQLSVDGSVSCASCHRPDHAFSDTASVSVGAHGRLGKRNAPSLINVAYRATFSWDGRSQTLEEQAGRPIHDSVEMDLSPSALESRIRSHASYRRAFRREFGRDPTARTISMALASYLRTLRAGDAPIDRFRMGDTLALSPAARRGAALFSGKAQCTVCHVGPLFTDGDFHNTGIAWADTAFTDVGRAAVTGLSEDRGRFKTPSLRNVSLTAPYMHDGSKRTLAEVVDFYDAGGRPNPGLDPFIQPLHLTPDEKQALVEFLRSLTSGLKRRF